jgi:hypothetical protein
MRRLLIAIVTSGTVAALANGCTILEGLPDVPEAGTTLGCGKSGEPCCNGSACNAMLTCLSGTCTPHGPDASTGMKDASGGDTGRADGASSPDVATKTDAASDSSTPDSSSPEWGTLTVLQMEGSTGNATTSFANPTAAGNLLVAMEPYNVAPSGSGWTQFESSDGSDSIYVWPNNPGGLMSFTIGGPPYLDVILVEFSGAPLSLTLDSEIDTGNKGSSVTSLDVSGGTAKMKNELELLYIDSNMATTASAGTSWSYITTDGDNNFGWWRAAPHSAGPSAKVTFSPSSQASLMAVSLETP